MIRIVWVSVLLSSHSVYSDVIVKTFTGIYFGSQSISYDGAKYNTFLGVKFANVVERFKEAVPVEDGDKKLDASKYGPACYQNNTSKYQFEMSEDCLYLDIYTPHVNGSLPVIVFIYGGSFFQGASRIYSGEYFMESKRVVTVIISYRVDAFGFLYLDDYSYPANLGIRDQILALRWIQRNIKNFGGDPTRVTITGQSAGGVSVDILMHSSLAKGLFVGGISQSGTTCSRWGLQPRCAGIQRRNLLAENIGCKMYLPEFMDQADDLVRCLNNKTAVQILNATQDFPLYLHGTLYPPVVESFFLQNPVIDSYPYQMKDNSTDVVPWITGVNSNEAYEIVSVNPLGKSIVLRMITQILAGFILPDFLFYRYTSLFPFFISEKIRHHYWDLYFHRIPEFINQVANEGFFYYPMVKCLRHIRSPTYAYYFDYRTPDQQGAGVPHCGELQYSWNSSSHVRLGDNNADEQISKNIVNAWIDFAYYQVANFSGVTWDRYNYKEDNVLIVDNNGVRMGTNPNKENNTFWQTLNIDTFSKSFFCNWF